MSRRGIGAADETLLEMIDERFWQKTDIRFDTTAMLDRIRAAIKRGEDDGTWLESRKIENTVIAELVNAVAMSQETSVVNALRARIARESAGAERQLRQFEWLLKAYEAEKLRETLDKPISMTMRRKYGEKLPFPRRSRMSIVLALGILALGVVVYVTWRRSRN